MRHTRSLRPLVALLVLAALGALCLQRSAAAPHLPGSFALSIHLEIAA